MLLCVLHIELGHFFGLYAGVDEYQHHDEFAIFSIIVIVPNLSGMRESTDNRLESQWLLPIGNVTCALVFVLGICFSCACRLF